MVVPSFLARVIGETSHLLLDTTICQQGIQTHSQPKVISSIKKGLTNNIKILNIIIWYRKFETLGYKGTGQKYFYLSIHDF